MFSKPVRRILYLFIAFLAGYHIYSFVSDFTTQEVIVLKQYTEALRKGDMHVGRKLSLDQKRMEPFKKRKKRLGAVKGEVQFTYYKIQNIRRSKDRKTTQISMQQIIRYNPPGVTSFWGTDEVVNNIRAVLVSPKSAWKIQTYSDNFFTPGMKE